MRLPHLFLLSALPFIATCFLTATPVRAQTAAAPDTTDALKQDVDTLNAQVKDKRSRVKELDATIAGYKDRIAQEEAKQASLENEVLLLDNRVQKKQLDIERAKTELEATQLEIDSLEKGIEIQTQSIDREKEYAANLIRSIRNMDDVSPLEVLLTKKSLSAFFDRLAEIKRLEGDLTDALERVKRAKADLVGQKKDRDAKLLVLADDQKNYQREQLALEAERNFKTSLVAETHMKQTEFERALYELRQQQQSTADDISTLEAKLKDKLNTIDESLARGDVLLNWPVDPSRGITVKFHDPTYPFRNLFEHPGVDVRASVGTTVHAAAGGYVAWNKKGRLYGNYTMLIHPGNIATVYAHLSKFLAQPDTYVDRGAVIGQSGGMPGMPGAGLSTGPHLHFEVRSGGIPVDPENYLPSAPGE